MNPAARFLGLRLRHGRDIDLPLYAYGTDLSDGARGARRAAPGSASRGSRGRS